MSYQKEPPYLFLKIGDDVISQVKKEAYRKLSKGTYENVLPDMFRAIPRFPIPGDDMMAFATALKTECLVPDANFTNVKYSRIKNVMCASTPTLPTINPDFKYAIILRQNFAMGMTATLCEGITAILSGKSVKCSRRFFDGPTCTFNTEEFRSQPSKLAQNTSVVFTNTMELTDIKTMTKRIKEGKPLEGLGLKVYSSSSQLKNEDVAVNAMSRVEKLFTEFAGLLTLEHAIYVDNASYPNMILLSVPRIQGLIQTLNSDSNSEPGYPAVAEVIWCPKHAIFGTFRIGEDGAINCHINDPNESSLQAFETLVSRKQSEAIQRIKEVKRFAHLPNAKPLPQELQDLQDCDPSIGQPGGWCQTWSAFQAECEVLDSPLHAALIRIASNSKKVFLGSAETTLFPVYMTWDTEGQELARLFADYPEKLNTTEEVIDGKKKTLVEWGCALDRMVRCLAVRYFQFMLKTTSWKDDAKLLADHLNLPLNRSTAPAAPETPHATPPEEDEPVPGVKMSLTLCVVKLPLAKSNAEFYQGHPFRISGENRTHADLLKALNDNLRSKTPMENTYAEKWHGSCLRPCCFSCLASRAVS